ncbi:TfoX/Sxy family protein [Gemmobacter nectariphilus]|uniref:TfoX/Sxy family protein n=1 Tax=Gemmobacter nectariphilus TaxID=220343 RepID=UPI000421BDC2|nr:TfoX/Sxy family protein [Gemmobacter nectariphilus]
MAADPGLLELMRSDMADRQDVREQRMFGGMAFMVSGHMACGLMPRGAFYRVGRARQAEALALDGTAVMNVTRRPMPDFVELAADCMGEDAARLTLLDMALTHIATLPPR